MRETPARDALRAMGLLRASHGGAWLEVRTSGTTDHPRTVVRSLASWVDSFEHLSRATGTTDADRVLVLGPVDTSADSRRAINRGDTHVGFLTVAPVGSHPVVPGPRSRLLTDRRSSAHSPVAGLGVLGHRAPLNSGWTSRVEHSWRWPGGDQGCINGPYRTTDTTMVHQ